MDEVRLNLKFIGEKTLPPQVSRHFAKGNHTSSGNDDGTFEKCPLSIFNYAVLLWKNLNHNSIGEFDSIKNNTNQTNTYGNHFANQKKKWIFSKKNSTFARENLFQSGNPGQSYSNHYEPMELIDISKIESDWDLEDAVLLLESQSRVSSTRIINEYLCNVINVFVKTILSSNMYKNLPQIFKVHFTNSEIPRELLPIIFESCSEYMPDLIDHVYIDNNVDFEKWIKKMESNKYYLFSQKCYKSWNMSNHQTNVIPNYLVGCIKSLFNHGDQSSKNHNNNYSYLLKENETNLRTMFDYYFQNDINIAEVFLKIHFEKESILYLELCDKLFHHYIEINSLFHSRRILLLYYSIMDVKIISKRLDTFIDLCLKYQKPILAKCSVNSIGLDSDTKDQLLIKVNKYLDEMGVNNDENQDSIEYWMESALDNEIYTLPISGDAGKSIEPTLSVEKTNYPASVRSSFAVEQSGIFSEKDSQTRGEHSKEVYDTFIAGGLERCIQILSTKKIDKNENTEKPIMNAQETKKLLKDFDEIVSETLNDPD